MLSVYAFTRVLKLSNFHCTIKVLKVKTLKKETVFK
jgi:hypothetical protein